jgi:hypothetical protein
MQKQHMKDLAFAQERCLGFQNQHDVLAEPKSMSVHRTPC